MEVLRTDFLFDIEALGGYVTPNGRGRNPEPIALRPSWGHVLRGGGGEPGYAVIVPELLVTDSPGVRVVFLVCLSALFCLSGCLTTAPKLSKGPEASSIWNMVTPPTLDALRLADHFRKKSIRERLIEVARSFLGVRYRFGGSSGEGFDCSGFVQTVFNRVGIELPRSSRDQFASGKIITYKDLRPGDVIAFDIRFRRRVSHVGIYVGEGKFIHSNRRGGSVRIADLSKKYYQHRLVGCVSFITKEHVASPSLARVPVSWRSSPISKHSILP